MVLARVGGAWAPTDPVLDPPRLPAWYKNNISGVFTQFHRLLLTTLFASFLNLESVWRSQHQVRHLSWSSWWNCSVKYYTVTMTSDGPCNYMKISLYNGELNLCLPSWTMSKLQNTRGPNVKHQHHWLNVQWANICSKVSPKFPLQRTQL